METIKCPACGTSLPDRGYFCPNCAMPTRCRSCNALLESNANACVECGTLVGSAPTQKVELDKRTETSWTARPSWMEEKEAHKNAASGSSSAADPTITSHERDRAEEAAWWKPVRNSRWIVTIGLVALGTFLLLLSNLGAGTTVGALGTSAVLLTVVPMRHLRWKLLAFVPAAYAIALILSFLFVVPIVIIFGGEGDSPQPSNDFGVIGSAPRTPTPQQLAPTPTPIDLDVTRRLGFETFGAVPWERPPGAEKYPIRDVVNGDTITVINVEDVDGSDLGWDTVRLIGVDSPDKDGRFTDEECYGPEASAFLANLLPEGSIVYLQIDNDNRIPDVEENNESNTGQWLRHVYIKPEGIDAYYLVTKILALGGYVDVKQYDENTYFHTELQDAEAVARQENRGTWGAC